MSRTSILALAFMLAAITLAVWLTADARGAARLAPPVPCTHKTRMDMFIDEDNIMWECRCYKLVRISLCSWEVVGGVDAVQSRRLARLHPRVWIPA